MEPQIFELLMFGIFKVFETLNYSGRFLSELTENWWNDDGCGKKDVFPEEIIGLGFENV